MGPLAALDWFFIVLMLALSVGIGFAVKDRADENGLEGFFVAGRSMRWWFLGTSIVATTFASDTPLAITGWIAQYGIAGNWFWWGGVLGTVAMTVFFARKWRDSGVVTDVEITELRYGGPQAMLLRTVKAAVNATFVNCVILGWVFAGMAKISEPFMDWHSLLGPSVYGAIAAVYPDVFLFNTLDNSITVILLLIVTLTYSTMGGLRAVILTDLIQFALAMAMAITVAYLAVDAIGGLDAMWAGLAEEYPSAPTNPYLSAEQIASFTPSFDTGVVGALGIPFSAFVLTLGFMWWTNGTVDGSGFVAQRLYSARDGTEAERGALWYAVAHFLLRSWPWAIAGVAALVLYPRAELAEWAQVFTACANDASACPVEVQACLDDRYSCSIDAYSLLVPKETVQADGSVLMSFVEDRERGYPALIRDVLPTGLLGLALASLMAAFMSTVSTHINWGASYVANDFYKRFVNPNASDRKLTWVSRVATVGIAALSAWVATQIESIGAMWELYGGMMAGLGLPHLMRWFWWRANAWTEISGMLVGLTLSTANFLVGQSGGYPEGQISLLPISMASHPIHVICWISLAAGVMSLVVTLLTPRVADEQLRAFATKVHPMGFWKGHNAGFDSERSLLESVFWWLLGTAGIYAGMFGIGHLLRLEHLAGMLLLLFAVFAIVGTIVGLGRVDARRQAAQG